MLFFFVSIDVDPAVCLSSVFQAWWERRSADDAHDYATDDESSGNSISSYPVEGLPVDEIRKTDIAYK